LSIREALVCAEPLLAQGSASPTTGGKNALEPPSLSANDLCPGFRYL
jgi:hypothetical protein